MTIYVLNKSAYENIHITNDTNFVFNGPLLLSSTKLEKLLQTVKADIIDFYINPEINAYVCIEYDNVKCIFSQSNG